MYIGKNGLPLPQLEEKVWALSFNWWTTWVDKASSKGEISSFLKEKKKKKELVCLQLDCTNQVTLTRGKFGEYVTKEIATRGNICDPL